MGNILDRNQIPRVIDTEKIEARNYNRDIDVLVAAINLMGRALTSNISTVNVATYNDLPADKGPYEVGTKFVVKDDTVDHADGTPKTNNRYAIYMVGLDSNGDKAWVLYSSGVNAAAVAAELASNPTFRAAVKGDKGDTGAVGPQGPKGDALSIAGIPSDLVIPGVKGTLQDPFSGPISQQDIDQIRWNAAQIKSDERLQNILEDTVFTDPIPDSGIGNRVSDGNDGYHMSVAKTEDYKNGLITRDEDGLAYFSFNMEIKDIGHFALPAEWKALDGKKITGLVPIVTNPLAVDVYKVVLPLPDLVKLQHAKGELSFPKDYALELVAVDEGTTHDTINLHITSNYPNENILTQLSGWTIFKNFAFAEGTGASGITQLDLRTATGKQAFGSLKLDKQYNVIVNNRAGEELRGLIHITEETATEKHGFGMLYGPGGARSSEIIANTSANRVYAVPKNIRDLMATIGGDHTATFTRPDGSPLRLGDHLFEDHGAFGSAVLYVFNPDINPLADPNTEPEKWTRKWVKSNTEVLDLTRYQDVNVILPYLTKGDVMLVKINQSPGGVVTGYEGVAQVTELDNITGYAKLVGLFTDISGTSKMGVVSLDKGANTIGMDATPLEVGDATGDGDAMNKGITMNTINQLIRTVKYVVEDSIKGDVYVGAGLQMQQTGQKPTGEEIFSCPPQAYADDLVDGSIMYVILSDGNVIPALISSTNNFVDIKYKVYVPGTNTAVSVGVLKKTVSSGGFTYEVVMENDYDASTITLQAQIVAMKHYK